MVYTGKKRNDGWDDFSFENQSFEGVQKGLGRQRKAAKQDCSTLMSQLGARAVIMQLQNRGYVLFVDSYCTSISLFKIQ